MEKTATNIINTTYLDVQFPEELINYVMEETAVCGKYVKKRKKGNITHYQAKRIGFWLLLKAESPGAGLIKNYTKQIPVLCRNFNISQRTFFNYIRQLEAMKLITRDGNKLRVCTWQQLGDVLDIDTKKRTHIKFEYAAKQKIHCWFAALEIQGNQESSKYMVNKKMNKNSEEINSLRTALNRRGFDNTKANDQEYTLKRLRMLYKENFVSGTEVHDIINRIRPDVNRGCKTIGEAWNTSAQVVSYWKAQMINQKIIEVYKPDPLIFRWKKRADGGKNEFCNVIWKKKKKQRIMFLCDQINVLKPLA